MGMQQLISGDHKKGPGLCQGWNTPSEISRRKDGAEQSGPGYELRDRSRSWTLDYSDSEAAGKTIFSGLKASHVIAGSRRGLLTRD